MKHKLFLILILIVEFEAIKCNSIEQLKFQNSSKSSYKNYSLNENVCKSELLILQQALSEGESWAVRIVDTWAKIQSGFLSGNTFNIGDFDTCVNFKHESLTYGIIHTQHCFVTMVPLPDSTLTDDQNDLSLKHLANFFRNNGVITINGFCMPSTCSNEKVTEFLNFNFLLENDLYAYEASCRDIHDVQFDAVTYLAISIFVTFLVLIIASTLYDLITINSKNPAPNKLYASFSVYSNGMKLFDMTKVKSSSSLNCLHGLRGLSIFWIIIGHRIYNQFHWGNSNNVKDQIYGNVFIGAILITFNLAVDTFLVMGAVLMTWATLKDCDNGKLNIMRMIWRRYLRYTPIYAALILFVVAFDGFMFQGPFYTSSVRDPCIENWWFTLLHVQNYIDPLRMCLDHGWYLSVDFQLFIISPFIIYFIHKYGKKFLAVPAILCGITIIYVIIISNVHDIRMPFPSLTYNYFKYVYLPTHSRAGPWFIGIILGYLLYIHRGKIFKVNGIVNSFMWILSLATLIAIIMLQYGFAIAHQPIAQAAHTSYLALHRNIWAISICWIIFACQHLKTGGIVRWFLSLPQWQPVSRMGLSMYLIGYVYQKYMIFNQRVPLYMNFWTFVPTIISDIVITAIISSVSYLSFEAPPLLIEDYVYRNIIKQS